jgi:hypothetical protein
MFEPKLFTGRVMFIDLDTLILGNIDHLAAYQGNFATLQDFWNPRGLGPAMMLFDAQWAQSIYIEWKATGYRQTGNGDQTFLENLDQGRFAHEIDILQTLYPGHFVSYKEHCTLSKRNWRFAKDPVNDQIRPPAAARVVCFHGHPRPHEVGGWVADYWREPEVING